MKVMAIKGTSCYEALAVFHIFDCETKKEVDYFECDNDRTANRKFRDYCKELEVELVEIEKI